MTIITEPPATRAASWTDLAAQIGEDLRPHAATNDTTGELPVAAFELLRDSGLTAALVPADAGGPGATHGEMGQTLRVLGRHDPAVAVTLAMHSHLLATQVWRHRHGQDASAVFEKVLGGALLVSTGASDWLASNGTAERVEGGFRVSARKAPASGCEVGTVVVTSIRWDDAPDGPQVLHCAIPLHTDGVSIDRTWDTMGQRATGSHTVVIDDVFVPDAAVSLIRPADVWHPFWNVVLGAAMPLVMAAYLGIADEAAVLARAIVGGRSDDHVTQLAGEMGNAHVTACDVIDGMFREARNLAFDNVDEVGAAMLSRKTVATDALIETVRLAIELTGGVGYSRSTDLERLYRDAHGALFHPLPRAKQLRFSGRVALGLPPVG